jgi:hypothetical protein
MYRTGLLILCLALFACNNKKKKDKEEGTGFSYEKFSERFKPVNPPYALSDTGLQNNKDTTGIRSEAFARFLSDSLKNRIFGRSSKVRYISLSRLKPDGNTSFYFVKAVSGQKKAALLYVFDEGQFSTVFPFLVPDANPATSQVSSLDKSFVITQNVVLKQPAAEGKDVYEYDAASKRFSLILTDPINKYTADVINPIDTLSRKHKFAGDYGRDKKHLVSIRDGRYPNQLTVFIHIDKNDGGCTGELKGDLLFTSPTTAIYRRSGDPCVMTFRFSSSSVTVHEDQGCGSHRGLDCSFDGNYTKRKESKPPKKKNSK